MVNFAPGLLEAYRLASNISERFRIDFSCSSKNVCVALLIVHFATKHQRTAMFGLRLIRVFVNMCRRHCQYSWPRWQQSASTRRRSKSESRGSKLWWPAIVNIATRLLICPQLARSAPQAFLSHLPNPIFEAKILRNCAEPFLQTPGLPLS